MTQILAITEPTEEVLLLVGELNDELGALYPPEQRHGLALNAIFAPHIRFFVARSEDDVGGCGGVALLQDFAEVKRMYVRPQIRGKGVADAIMCRLIAETRKAGLSCLRAETGPKSLAAAGFYRRFGFRTCPAFEPYASLPPPGSRAAFFWRSRCHEY
jgi:putative acetyltransferase